MKIFRESLTDPANKQTNSRYFFKKVLKIQQQKLLIP